MADDIISPETETMYHRLSYVIFVVANPQCRLMIASNLNDIAH